MDESTLAYCAGIIDADGSICLVTSQTREPTVGFSLRLAINQTDVEAIDLLATTFGGKPWFNMKKTSARTGRPTCCWQLCAQKAEAAIKLLLPYLRIKKRQAELALEFQRMLHDRRRWISYRCSITPKTRRAYTCTRYRLSPIARKEARQIAHALRSLNDSRTTHQRPLAVWNEQAKSPVA